LLRREPVLGQILVVDNPNAARRVSAAPSAAAKVRGVVGAAILADDPEVVRPGKGNCPVRDDRGDAPSGPELEVPCSQIVEVVARGKANDASV